MAFVPPQLPKKLAQIFQKANQSHVAGDLEAAKKGYGEVLMQSPKFFEALHLMGVLSCQIKDFSAAVGYIDKAIKLSPNPVFYFSKGVAHQELGQTGLAEIAYLQALKLRPKYPEVNYNLGNLRRSQNKHKESLEFFERAVSQMPGYVEAHYNKANALKDIGDFERALQAYDHVIFLNKNYAQAYLNKGMTFKEMRLYDQALECYREALQVRPNYADAYSNMGILYTELKLWREALMSFQEALTLDPTHAQALWNKSLLLLLHSDYKGGFGLYSNRWRTEVMISPLLSTDKPWFLDYSAKVSRLLIWPEQGIGDEVMFGSLLTQAHSLADHLIVQVDQRLIALFERSFSGITFKPKHEIVDEGLYDAHLPIGQLAEIFCQSIEAFNTIKPNYILSNTARVDFLKSKLPQNGKPTIGLSWSSKNDKKGKDRSVTLEQLISAITGQDHIDNRFAGEIKENRYNFVSLQYGAMTQDLESVQSQFGIEVISYSDIDNYSDIDGLAALIQICDLVVSIDNSTVHLSGALGKKTWVLLPYSSDWRWGLDSQESNWYPSLKLFRQERAGDWSQVFIKLGEALQSFF
jgi:tetratricopeptide (TPR) repeat protein